MLIKYNNSVYLARIAHHERLPSTSNIFLKKYVMLLISLIASKKIDASSFERFDCFPIEYITSGTI